MTHILAIDQGTTSSRAIVFDGALRPIATSQREFPQHYPQPGQVEHDPDDLWQSTLTTCREAMAKARVTARDIASLGITNQRETTLVWDLATGKPLHRAIVWQDRRTSDACQNLKARGHEPFVTARTGLLLDPYFSATKIAWILDAVPGARARAVRGELAFGTVDTWLLWQLTGGRVHATDATNASRTLLYDIHRGDWDDDLCALFQVPRAILPEVHDCAADFGTSDAALFDGAIAIRGIAGDQQAALVGQACFTPGMMKATYGTGCFALLNTGSTAVTSRNRLLTTIAYQMQGQRTYALEGSIFVAGAAVQWLRDGLGLIKTAAEASELAKSSDPDQAVYLVPAFAGLGAPYWEPDARATLTGMSRGTTRADLARAALEQVAYQTRDLIEAMHKDWPQADAQAGSVQKLVLRVDGGMVVSDWTMQAIADILGAPVDRSTVSETTALGAAWLAGHQAGVYPAMSKIGKTWALDRRFAPTMGAHERARKYAGWQAAVRATIAVAKSG